MKYIENVSFLVILAGLIISCKSNDPEPSIAGTWKISTYSVTGCTNASDNLAETPCGTSGLSVSVECETWVITSNTITATSPIIVGSIAFNYTLNGSTLTTSIGGTTISTATYAVTATTLTVTFDLGSSNPGCKIVEKFTKQ